MNVEAIENTKKLETSEKILPEGYECQGYLGTEEVVEYGGRVITTRFKFKIFNAQKGITRDFSFEFYSSARAQYVSFSPDGRKLTVTYFMEERIIPEYKQSTMETFKPEKNPKLVVIQTNVTKLPDEKLIKKAA